MCVALAVRKPEKLRPWRLSVAFSLLIFFRTFALKRTFNAAAPVANFQISDRSLCTDRLNLCYIRPPAGRQQKNPLVERTFAKTDRWERQGWVCEMAKSRRFHTLLGFAADGRTSPNLRLAGWPGRGAGRPDPRSLIGDITKAYCALQQEYLHRTDWCAHDIVQSRSRPSNVCNNT